jgi:radical SAM superfamily enzyme YgiQ (UPF0313 family)
MSLGLESNVQRLLNDFHKGTKIEDNERIVEEASSLGIFLHVSFIIGFPSETPAEAIQTLSFIRRYIDKIDHAEIYLYENFKHSLGFEKAQEQFAVPLNSECREVIEDVYHRVLASFNSVGSAFLNQGQIYSKEASEIKQELLGECSRRLLMSSQIEKIQRCKEKQILMLDKAIADLSGHPGLASNE